jgi:SAM-dependent methyltransferase
LAYPNKFNLVILVSVFEHVDNPYKASDSIFAIMKPGGYLFNSTPFLFPHHPSPEDNFRYSPKALRSIHTDSGFEWLEGDFHAKYRSSAGIGDTNPERMLDPQALMFSYALCRKPL